MKNCKVLEVLKKLAPLIDAEAHGKITRFEYYTKVNALLGEIDDAARNRCPALENLKNENELA